MIAGERRTAARAAPVHAPWDGAVAGECSLGSADDMDAAVAAATAAAGACRAMPAFERASVLRRIADALQARAAEFAALLAREAGKPLALAQGEIARALFVLRDGAEEATRIGGEVIPLDVMPAGTQRLGFTRRMPLAPVAAITPFNFPILLAAHKIAPAIACGASVVLKPPPQDPLTTVLLGDILAQSGYPAGGLNVVPCDLPVAERLVRDERVRMISFTGSAKAGWAIRAAAGTRRVALELGGNAGVVIEPDADLERAAERCVAGGYAYAGQSCISVQRILVHRDVYDDFLARYVPKVAKLRTGDPLDGATDVGPLISEDAAKRAEAWVRAALAQGAVARCGGTRAGAVLEPCVLTGTRPDQQVNCEELFAPVTTVSAYADFDAALDQVNASPFGLQAGVFTHDVRRLLHAWDRLEVGGVNANEIPSWRIDRAPYGGAKASGLGREGVRYAIQEMTELRLLTLHGE